MQGRSSETRGAVMEPPRKPAPAPEMSRIERMVGTWSGSAEIVSAPPQAMKGVIPEGMDTGKPLSFPGGGKYEWVLGGMFLRGQGWHEMGHGGRVNYVEYIAWDAKAGKYRNWWFSDWGMFGEGWMTFDADGRTLRAKAEAVDPRGRPSRRERTMTFVDEETMEWTWSEDGPDGAVKLKGASRRQR